MLDEVRHALTNRAEALRSEERLLRQYLCFCTSKASKLAQALQEVELWRKLRREERLLRQYLCFCTSKNKLLYW